jgi:stage V sporulation protein B
LVNQLTTGVFTALLTLFLVRALSPHEYGEFALAIAIVGLLAIPSDLGISLSAARFIAVHHGDRAAIARVMSTALQLKLLVSGVVSVGLVIAAGTIARGYHEPAVTWPLRALGIGLFGWSLFSFYVYAFNAQQRTAVNTRIIGLESAMEVGASIVLVLAGTGATGAAFGWAAGYIFGAVVGTVTTAQMLGWSAIDVRLRSREMRRRVLSYAGAVAIVDVSWTVFAQIDVLLIGAILTTTAVANFQAPMRLLVFLSYPTAAVASAVAPRLGRELQGANRGEVFARACRFVILLQAMAVPPLLVWPRAIVDILLGTSYHQAASVLRALAPYVFLIGPATLAAYALDYLGEARRRIPSALAAVVINLAIDLTLIPRVGVVGGAIGSDVAYLVYVVAHLQICLSINGLRWAWLLRSTGRAAVAAAAMAGVMLAFGTGSVPAWELAAGGVCSVLAYAATLVVIGEVSREELRTAVMATRRLLRR